MVSSLLSASMQVMEKGNSQDKVKRVPIYVTPSVRDTIMKLRRGNQTYGDVVEGSIVQTVKGAVSPTMFESLNAIGRYPLKKSVEFRGWFDEEFRFWCVENKKLALLGMGVTYSEIISSIEEALEGHVLSFTEYPDEKHSVDSLVLKRDLMDCIDFAMVLQLMNEKYGE